MAFLNFNHYRKKELAQIAAITAENRVVNLMTEELLRYFIDENYKIPTDIKNDLIYCERSLRVLVNTFNEICENDIDVPLKRMLEFLKVEINEVQWEYKLLLLNMFDSTKDFRQNLQSRGFEVIPEMSDIILSKEMDEAVFALEWDIKPKAVRMRRTKAALFQIYQEFKMDFKRFQEEQNKAKNIANELEETSPEKKLRKTKSPKKKITPKVKKTLLKKKEEVRHYPRTRSVTKLIEAELLLEKAPPNISEIPQEEMLQNDFMRMLELVTHKESKEMIEELGKRPKRKITKKVRADFVYGEVQSKRRRTK